VRQRLEGVYRLLVVTSVGAGAKQLSEWNMTLAPTSPAQESTWRKSWTNDGRLVYFPLVGELAYLRGGHLNGDGKFAPSARPPGPTKDSVRVRYEPTGGVLRLDGAPFEAFDAGTFYWVYAVDAKGGFSGRWLGGGLEVAPIQTPLGTLGEQAEGYFCAQRFDPS
jgi:hypothetical protein